MTEEILKMVVALKAQKISVSRIETDLKFSNGLIGKAAKGESSLSAEKFKKFEDYFKQKTGVQPAPSPQTTQRPAQRHSV